MWAALFIILILPLTLTFILKIEKDSLEKNLVNYLFGPWNIVIDSNWSLKI